MLQLPTGISLAQTGLVALCALGVSICYGAGWWFYRTKRKEIPMIDSVPLGYLIAGPRRAREVALFELVKNGHVRHDAENRFFADPHASPNNLSRVDGELLMHLINEGPKRASELFQLPLPSLELVEKFLERSRLAISVSDSVLFLALTIVPPILATALADREHLLRAEFNLGHVALACVWLAFFDVRRRFHRRTDLGDRLVAEFRRDVETRKKTDLQARANGEASEYDRLWALKDEVVLEGFRSLGGTPFSPIGQKREPGPPG